MNSLKEFKKARENISPYIKKTALRHSFVLSEQAGARVYLKMENEQRTGSFKVRGALNKILSLSKEEKKRGLISCSAGNHAQGVAYAAKCVKAKALLVLPENTAIVKEEAIRRFSAKTVLYGSIYDESYNHTLKLAKETNRVFIHAFQDQQVIRGQGSIALELLEQEPDLDSVIVPVGGGGLISGTACAIKLIRPACRVYGVVSSMAPAMEFMFHKKTYSPNRHFSPGGLADGITVKNPGRGLFNSYIAKYADDIISVTDDETASAIAVLLEREKTLVEGAGAVAVAGLLKQSKKWNIGKKCGVLISGGNIDLNILARVIERGLKTAGRLSRLSVLVKDQPGTLNQITGVLSTAGSNILSVHHERNNPRLPQGLARIEFLIESRGFKHLKQIRSALQKYSIKENLP